VFLDDIAFQHFVFTGAGLHIRSCSILHVDNTYVRNGPVEAHLLLNRVDVTNAVLLRSARIASRLQQMLEIVAHATAPAKQIGPHCDNPYVCALHDHCWKFLPEGNVMELYRGKKKGFDLVARGVTRLADIPESEKLTANQKIQRDSAINGQPHVDHETLRKFLARLE